MPSLLQSDAALKGPCDVIYSDTSPLPPSSGPPRNHSTPDVSKEQEDIKHNYDGFSTPSAGRRPQIGVDLRISLAITRRSCVCRASCIRKKPPKHIGDFQLLPAIRTWVVVGVLWGEGGVGKLSTQRCSGERRIRADRHSITGCDDSGSALAAEEQNAGWMRLSAALLLQSESSSLTDADGGTDNSAQLSRIQLWTLV